MKERIVPGTMAKPVGPYSHATKVAAKQLIFIAGQVPIDKDGNVVGIEPAALLPSLARAAPSTQLPAAPLPAPISGGQD